MFWKSSGGLLVAVLLACGGGEALAHGERAQEPFLRTRTLHWYDVVWSTDKLAVNEEIVVTGKVRVYDDWPVNIPEPSTAFLGNATPGPVFVRKASYLNDVPMIQSGGLELNRDYDFRIVLQARVPGRHHVHPMISVKDAGGLVGPGKWIEVTGAWEDFKYPVTTLTGAKIENLETFGVGNAVRWHLLWVALAAFWLLWWVLRPMLLPRNILVQQGTSASEDLLVTRTDKFVGAALLIGTVALVTVGYFWAEASYPRTIPLQAGRVKIEVPPAPEDKIKVKIERATYDVPGRSMRLALKVTNNLERPIQLGEFETANLRFVELGLAPTAASVSPAYPKELLARNGLKVDDNAPLKPGESRAVKIEATDVAWEIERLTSFMNDPDSRFGALLFFYDDQQARHIATIGGPIVPTFVR